ncbi:unnamed protein product [Cuscuta campestris]|uniref:Uncharacterized protein n=1 Tax=Cuscuta campestris TaxID=132261 RepID=A0A484MXS9_9ASTE|nr:unnamed protein product [Cuscuta campestris]
MSLWIPTKDHFRAQYSVCGELEDAVAIVKIKLSADNMVKFREMPFGHFIDMRKLQFSGQLIHILMLHLVRQQPEDEMWFLINGTLQIARYPFSSPRQALLPFIAVHLRCLLRRAKSGKRFQLRIVLVAVWVSMAYGNGYGLEGGWPVWVYLSFTHHG